jgi:hypothetical protein
VGVAEFSVTFAVNYSIKKIKNKLLGKLDFHTIDDNFVIGIIQYNSTHCPIPLTLNSIVILFNSSEMHIPCRSILN